MDGDRFLNLDGWSSPAMGDVFRFAVTDPLLGRRHRPPAGPPAPQVAPELKLLAHPPMPGEPARLTWLGHASWLVQLDGVSLLIDPVLGDSIPGVRRAVPPGLAISQLPHIDAVLVSHSHYDHLDKPTLVAVRAPVVAGLGTAGVLSGEGLQVTELGWWQATKIGDLRVTFVPSHHWSRRGLFDTNNTLWGGFVIEGSSATLYHAGDSGYFDGFKEIGRRFHLDAAMLPIGAYAPEWFMHQSHMTPEEAVQAFVDLRARTFLAMHWGTFRLTDEPLDEPPRRFHAEWSRRGLPQKEGLVLAVGQTVEVGRAPGPADVAPLLRSRR